MTAQMKDPGTEAIRKMADALGREPYDHFGRLGVDLTPVGSVSHERARRIALAGYRLGLLERSGLVQTYINRDGSIAGWKVRKDRTR